MSILLSAKSDPRTIEIADKIKEAMFRNNIKVSQLAEQTGISKNKISSYLSGNTQPDSDDLTSSFKSS